MRFESSGLIDLEHCHVWVRVQDGMLDKQDYGSERKALTRKSRRISIRQDSRLNFYVYLEKGIRIGEDMRKYHMVEHYNEGGKQYIKKNCLLRELFRRTFRRTCLIVFVINN